MQENNGFQITQNIFLRKLLLKNIMRAAHKLIVLIYKKFERLVTAGLMSRCLDTYTTVLSNPSFMGVLCLFSRRVSCLDAFSTYPLTRSCPAYPTG